MLLKCKTGFLVLSVISLSFVLYSASSTPQNQRLRSSHAFSESNREGRHRTPRHKVVRHAEARKLPQSSSSPGACECMDYWECVSKDGHVYSYCGISDSEVCCFNKHKDAGKIDEGNNAISTSPFIASTSTTPIPYEGLFATGNGITRSNDFVTELPSTPPPPATTSIFTDVDYFFSLEDGVGNLKRITTRPEEPESTSTFKNVDGDVSCGRQTVNWDLDSTAQFKEWPWHVALLEIQEDLYICGGTLISRDEVVTAAHCVRPYTFRNSPTLKIRAGEYDVSTNSEPDPYSEAAVDEIAIHPEFNNATLANDIAIVKLKQPLNYSSNIRPACIQSHRHPQLDTLQISLEAQCVVAGWGRVTEASPFSVTLKEIVVPLWSHVACEEQLRKNFGATYQLSETAICAGKRGHDACDGDGGGGLVCFDEIHQAWNLVGVVSFGISCGDQDTPAVYTSVPSYLNWINSSFK